MLGYEPSLVVNDNSSLIVQLLNADDKSSRNGRHEATGSPVRIPSASRLVLRKTLEDAKCGDQPEVESTASSSSIDACGQSEVNCSDVNESPSFGVPKAETGSAQEDDESVELCSVSLSSSRRNKRKMTEPRRRATTDFSIRSICSSSNSDVDVDDDEREQERTTDNDVKRWRPDLDLTSRSDEASASVAALSSGSAQLKAMVSMADNISAINHVKPFLFYPLNIPRVHYASSSGNHLSQSSASMTASLNSLLTASSMANGSLTFVQPTFTTPTAVVVTKPKASVRRRRRPSPSIRADNIPSPTEDSAQRLMLLNDDNVDYCDDNISHCGQQVPPPFDVEDCSRRKRRPGGGCRRATSASAAANGSSSSVSPDGCSPHLIRRRYSSDRARRSPSTTTIVIDNTGSHSRASSPLRKNYKNMTKQRRIEANARERTRVHTISAAFESLRRAVPSYSYNQRLSKLAILRIACSYILALARLADLDYAVSGTSRGTRRDDQESSLTFAECVDLCTQTIQTEGKAKRRH